MTLYSGENVKIIHTAELEGTALDNNDVNSVDLIIYDSSLNELVARTAMTWDAGNSRWQYNWDTSSPLRAAGTYRAQVFIVNADSTEVWEWKRIRLARNPNDP